MTLQQLLETDTSPGKQEYTCVASERGSVSRLPARSYDYINRWLYQFAVDNPPSENVSFLRALLQQRQDFGERLIEQRLVIYQRWVKSFDKTLTNEAILAANKALLLERLMGTVNMNSEYDPDAAS